MGGVQVTLPSDAISPGASSSSSTSANTSASTDSASAAAYEAGRAEAAAQFERLIPALGVQVYDDAVARIEHMHAEALGQQEHLVSTSYTGFTLYIYIYMNARKALTNHLCVCLCLYIYGDVQVASLNAMLAATPELQQSAGNGSSSRARCVSETKGLRDCLQASSSSSTSGSGSSTKAGVLACQGAAAEFLQCANQAVVQQAK